MPLTSGTKLGPYEIVGPLGRGGMGEVYRATDSRLNREVAIKVLPAQTASDADHRARLEREARALAALSHPNICTLHDIGRSGETDYIVMELVHGETLDARLARGPLPLPELLARGAEIAQALHVAHRAGVLHRDLKPANIMLTRTGAKLMDFGLGRSVAPEPSAGGHTQASTQSVPITGEGRIVGTVQYMAPEQLEGRAADVRSDIWALGVTLYEMATAQRPFEGTSSASVIGAILRDEPPPLAERAPLTPPALGRLVSRCLAKDPDERWQSAGDLAHELRWIGGGELPADSGAGTGVRGLRPASSRLALVGAVCLTVLIVVAAVLIGRRLNPAPEPAIRSQVPVPDPAARMIPRQGFSVSPDGRMLLFLLPDSTNEDRLYLRRLADDAVVAIGEPGARAPFWSPDSRQIAYVTSEDKLVKLNVSGGAAQTVCKVSSFGEGTWTRDRWLVFSAASGPLLRVRDSGGDPETVTVLDHARQETSHQYPELLPDGRHFTYVTDPPLGPSKFRVKVGSTSGGLGHDLMVVHHAPVSDRRGWIVFMRDRTLLAQRVAPDGSRLIGEPVPMADAPDRSGSAADPIVKLGGGVLVYRSLNTRPVEISWYSRSGSRLRRVAGEAHVIAPEVSRDGRRAVMRGVQGGETWLVGVDLESGAVQRLTSMEAWNSWPIWDARSRNVLYASGLFDGSTAISELDPETPDEVRTLARRSYYLRPEFDAGAAGLIVNQLGPNNTSDVALLDRESGAEVRLLANTSADEVGGVPLGDGESFVYASNTTGRYELYVASLNRRERPSRLTREGCGMNLVVSRRPVWVVGDELFYFSPDGQTMRSLRVSWAGGEWRATDDRVLFDLPPGLRGLCPAPDGSRFLMLTNDRSQMLPMVTLVQGWRSELNAH